jgi:IclR family acetate operon transcriptional repressor
VTAVGRAVRTGDDDLRAAVSVSLPSTRFSRDTVISIVRELSNSTAGIEKTFAGKGERARSRARRPGTDQYA